MAERFAAVDIGGTKTVLAMPGAEPERLPTMRDGETGPEALNRILATVAELLEGSGITHLGMVCPGHITEHGIALSPNLPGLESFDLPAAIAAELPGYTLALGHDVRAGAFAELRSGVLHGIETGVYVNLGTGVFAAPCLGGRVLTGAHGMAGEIGYTRVTGDERILEEIAGGGALLASARRASGLEGLTASEVLTSDDARLLPIAGEALDRIAESLAGLILTLDPARIAIGGGLMAAGEALLEALRTRLRVLGADTAELCASAFVHDAALRGAQVLAEEAAHGELPEWALLLKG